MSERTDDCNSEAGQCVQCGYLLVGLNADSRCPECGLTLETSRYSSRFPFVYLPLRRQALFRIGVSIHGVFWVSSILSGPYLGRMGEGPRALARLLWHASFLLMFPLGLALLIQGVRFVLLPEDAYIRPMNSVAYGGLFIASLIAFFVALANLHIT